MTPVVVIGVGSPFGADRLGWDVVERLQQHDGMREYFPERVALISSDRPGIGLLEYMRGSRLAILIDAVQAGLTPGDIVYLEEDRIRTMPSHCSTHGFGIAEALALGHSLGDLPARTVLLGLEVGANTERMPDRRDVARLAERVFAELQNFYCDQADAVI